MTLTEIAQNKDWDLDKSPYTNNPLMPGHTYLEIYDILFKPFGKDNINLLEMGYQYGPSIRLWWEYFNKNSNIFACDIRDTEQCYNNVLYEAFPHKKETNLTLEDFKNVFLKQVDLTNAEEYLLNFENNYFDIIIDDASHYPKDIIQNFLNFIPKLKTEGIYIVEDLGGGGEGTEGIFKIEDALEEKGYDLKIINMAYPQRIDNIIGIFYYSDSKNTEYFDNFYYESRDWETNPKCHGNYAIKKQQELLNSGVKPWNPHTV